ncbi:antagonist of KipI [Parapedobacter koreensis]|uniref:Antagonist of KipI n=2 Tax=Parapedobacter koreensis TaxID=332977 RepID=A0A1H7MTH1_9SPHI|nr:antagonist of KipI [Parapedobacter koreensis]
MMSTIQDMGRWGYLSQGVPISGAMDRLAARIANLAVGNTGEQAVIEFTYGNAAFQAETDILLAYSGDGAILEANSTPLPPDRPLFIPTGTYIHLATNPSGCRSYLAVAGGWDVPEALGSRSTYTTAAIGGLQGRALQGGDMLQACSSLTDITVELFRRLQRQTINYPPWGIARWLFLSKKRNTVRIVPAHEFTWFRGESVVNFLSSPFTVSTTSNRMGYQLDGPPTHRFVSRELLSTAVAPGTIQVTGNGSLVLLMADCQTTGGYPRIAQVAAVDMPLCAQFKPGDIIYFKEISRIEAEKLYIHHENQLSKLAIALATNLLTAR